MINQDNNVATFGKFAIFDTLITHISLPKMAVKKVTDYIKYSISINYSIS